MIVHTFVVFCQYFWLCRVAVTAQFNLSNQVINYNIGEPAISYAYTATAEPEWCGYNVLGDLAIYSDDLATTPYSGATFSFSSGAVSVYTTDAALGNTFETVYITATSISNWPTYRPAPVALTVNFISDPCGLTTFIPTVTNPVFSVQLDVTSKTF